MRVFLLLPLFACNQDYDVIGKPVEVDPGDVTECGFTQVEDTDFYEYDCNPVFSTTGEGWAASIDSTAFAVTEVMDHPFYQLWYTGVPDDGDMGEYGLGYAVSPQGTDWTPHEDNPLLEEPDDDEWDYSSMDAMHVVWDPEERSYLMVYQGLNEDLQNLDMGVATSPDGVDWERSDDNPVLDLMEHVDGVSGWCWPLGLSLGEVAGYTGYIAGNSGRNDACEVYRINASDETHWETDDEVQLEAGDAGEFDDEGFVSIAVAELDGERYMFYAGFGDWLQNGNYQMSNEHFLGYAIRDDGEWEKQDGPVPVNQTDDGMVTAVAASTVGDRIHLWITDLYEIDGEEQSAVGYYLFDPNRGEEHED